MGELNFRVPLDEYKRKGDGFGDRGGKHFGIDYEADEGTSVLASEAGKVIRASSNQSYGKIVVIDHTPNAPDNKRHIYSSYAHLDKISVGAGKIVSKGDKIGSVGKTGRSSGSHLHFEIIDTGNSGKMTWNSDGAMGNAGNQNRKDPELYFGRDTEVDGNIGDHPISEEHLQSIFDRLSFDLDDSFRLQVLIDGKK